MNIVNEIWKDILDYEGYYQVSSFGRVRSCDRSVCGRHGSTRFLKAKLMKLSLSSSGYFYIDLSVNSDSKTYAVHRLVALAFLGDRPKGFDINHIDGNKLNNALDNLEYCSHLQNVHHSFAIGLQVNPKGESHPLAKLSEIQVLEIRKLSDVGCMSQRNIAKMYQVDRTTISDIVRRKTWSHIS